MLLTGKYNLFSLTCMIKLGWKLNGNTNLIYITKDEARINFDIKIPTPKGVMFVMYFKRNSEIACAGADVKAKMSVAQAYDKLGHCSKDMIRKSAKLLGWEWLPDNMKPCEVCAAGKAKLKNVPKASDHVASEVCNERIFVDIASIRRFASVQKVTKPNWRIMVDEYTQLNFSDFFETKNGMVEPTCEQLHKCKKRVEKL